MINCQAKPNRFFMVFLVLRGYLYLGVRHHLATRSNERGVKIEDNVDEEYDVDDAVDDQQGHVLAGLVFERDVVGHHDGRVKGQT